MPSLQKHDDETAQEYADRLELAQFLESNHLTGGAYVDAKTRRRAAAAKETQKNKIRGIFAVGGAFMLFIGVTGWRASPGSRIAGLVMGGAIIGILAYRHFKRRRTAGDS